MIVNLISRRPDPRTSVRGDKQRNGLQANAGVKLAYKPGSVQGRSPWAIIPLGRRLPDGSSDLPGSSASRAIAPLFGLAPDGVWRAVPVTRSAVGSYPTVSPSPVPLPGLRQTALCSTFRRLAAPGS
jgi:hypothetical protein